MIKIAVIVNTCKLPAWQYYLLERIFALPGVQLVAVWLVPAPRRAWHERWLDWSLKRIQMVACWLNRRPWQAEQQRDIQALLADHQLSLQPLAVSSTQPNLILDLGIRSQELLAALKHMPPCAIWQLVYGAEVQSDPTWAAVREYTQGQSTALTGVIAYATAQSSPSWLWRATNSLEGSLAIAVDALYWKLAQSVPALLSQLSRAESVEQFLRQRHGVLADMPSPSVDLLPPAEQLSISLSRLKLLAHTLYLNAWHAWQRLIGKLVLRRQWILLAMPVQNPLAQLQDWPKAQRLLPPPCSFWADPCLVQQADKSYVFFEHYRFATKRGHLACLELYPDGSHSQPVPILEADYHLSYPFVFNYAGELYLVPESGDNATVDLYRCTSFPYQWVKVKTLLAGVSAYDATLHEHEGRWWMFVNLRPHPGCSPHELLYLFSATSPLSSEWEAHPQNPVVVQAGSARPAGKLFSYAGKLYRPSQNCAGSYGRGLNLNEIIEWNRETYRERTVSQCIPAGRENLHGMHTLSWLGGWALSDGIYVRKRWQ